MVRSTLKIFFERGAFNYVYAVLGFVLFTGISLAASFLFHLDVVLTKLPRLLLVLVMALAGGYVFGRLGDRLLFGFLFMVIAAILTSFAALVWYLV